MLCVQEADRGHCKQPPELEKVRAVQAGVLLRQGMPSPALETGRAQAGVPRAVCVHDLSGQRGVPAAHPVRMCVPLRHGVRPRSVQDRVCPAPTPRLPQGLVCMHDLQAGLHGGGKTSPPALITQMTTGAVAPMDERSHDEPSHWLGRLKTQGWTATFALQVRRGLK